MKQYSFRVLRMPIIAAVVLLCPVYARAGEQETTFVFTDISEQSGLRPHLAGALNHAVAWGDIDGDGRPDLFLGNFDKGGNPKYGLTEAIPNRLFRNAGEGRFVHISMPAIETRGRTSGAVLADFDNDGDLDLFVGNNTHPPGKADQQPALRQPSALYRNDAGRFVDVSASCGACPADQFFVRDIGVFDYDGDGLLDMLVLEDRVFRPRAHSRLFRNLGGMKFEDVTAAAGLPDDLYGFGIAVADLNGDGRPDFFICGPNRLYLSGPDGRYRQAESLRDLFDIRAASAEEFVTGAWLGDIDNDGDMDLVIGTHYAPAKIRVYLNEGLRDGIPRFRDITAEVGLPLLPAKAPSPQIADFDNDGLPDLYWSAWFAEGAARWPFICRGLGVKDGLPRFAVPSVQGIDVNRKVDAPAGKRGMVYYVNGPAIDFDGDGDLDLFAGIWPDENSRLFRNDTPRRGNWLAVRVEGTRMNRMGVGATVRIEAGGTLLGCQQLTMNGGYSGSHPPAAHFGLGPRKTVDVVVVFPSRSQPVKMAGVDACQTLVVKEPRQ